MTNRPWLAHYPENVDHELATAPFATLPELVRAAGDSYADTKAFTQCMPNGMNGSLTYRQVDDLSDDFCGVSSRSGRGEAGRPHSGSDAQLPGLSRCCLRGLQSRMRFWSTPILCIPRRK